MNTDRSHPLQISPELVLVDPALRVETLATLSVAEADGAAGSAAAAPESRDVAGVTGLTESREEGTSSRTNVTHEPRRSRRRVRRTVALVSTAIAGVAGYFVATAIAGSPLVVREPSAPSSPSRTPTTIAAPTAIGAAGPSGRHTTTASAATEPKPPVAPSTRVTRPRPSTPRVAGKTLAWAPVPGASGYRLQLFRDEELVYETATKQPTVVIPRRWTLHGRRHQLRHGVYRWYVWPVIGARRQSRATVQARLVI